MKKILNPSNQYNFLINHIKYDIDLINDYDKVDINTELEQLNKYLVKINTLIDKFKKSATDNGFVLDKIQKFIIAHESKQVNKYLNVVPTDNTFNIYMRHVATYKLAFSYFSKYEDLKIFISMTVCSLLENINEYYIGRLDNSTCTTAEMINYFEQLQLNNYQDLDKLIVIVVSNIEKYRCIDDMLSLDLENANDQHNKCTSMIKFLDYLKETYNFKTGVDMLLVMIHTKCLMINKSVNKNHSQMMVLYAFFDQIVLRQSIMYFWKFKQLKNITSNFSIDIVPFIHYTIILHDIPLINYLYTNIKNDYPDDIVYVDQLMNIVELVPDSTKIKQNDLLLDNEDNNDDVDENEDYNDDDDMSDDLSEELDNELLSSDDEDDKNKQAIVSADIQEHISTNIKKYKTH